MYAGLSEDEFDEYLEEMYWDCYTRVQEQAYEKLKAVAVNVGSLKPLSPGFSVYAPWKDLQQLRLLSEAVRSGIREFRESYQSCLLPAFAEDWPEYF